MNRNWLIGLGLATSIVAVLNLTHADNAFVQTVRSANVHRTADTGPMTILTRTIPLAAGATLRFSRPTGDIEIEGTDEASASLTVRTNGMETDIDASSFPLTIDAQPGGTLVQAEPGSSGFGDLTYVLKVPRSAQLEVEGDAGDLTAAHLKGGSFTAKLNRGNASVRDVIGPVTVKLGQGNLRLDAVDGATKAALGQGNIRLKQVHGAMSLSVGQGNIQLTRVDGALAVRAGQGRISGDLVGTNSGVTASVGSGDVSLTVPAAWDANVTLASDNGDLDLTGWPAGVDLSEQHRYEGRFGAGGSAIQLQTHHGSVRLKAEGASE